MSSCTNMNSLLEGPNLFNGAIGSWDVSRATSIKSLFFSANSFNANLSRWDTSSVRCLRTFGTFGSLAPFD